MDLKDSMKPSREPKIITHGGNNNGLLLAALKHARQLFSNAFEQHWKTFPTQCKI